MREPQLGFRHSSSTRTRTSGVDAALMLLGAYCETSEAGARAAAPDGTLWNWASLRRDVLDPGFHRVMPPGDERSTRLVRGPAHRQHRPAGRRPGICPRQPERLPEALQRLERHER